MSHLDQLTYLIVNGPPSDRQRQEELEHEDAVARFELEGELLPYRSRMWDDGPDTDDYL